MKREYTAPAYRVAGNFIGGNWVSFDGETMPAISPADGEFLCDLPSSTPDDVDDALASAAQGATSMAGMAVWDRAALCQRIGNAIERDRQRLAEVVSWDQGKPLAEALGEVDLAAHGFHHAGELVRWREGRVLSAATPGKCAVVFHVPKGIVGVITPWNFPINIPTEYICAALAAGNSVVWIPAPSTSLCAAVFMDTLASADLPPGAVNLVIGSGPIAGAALTRDPRIAAMCFTGSPGVGQLIASAAAGKSQLLELGGNGPVIVLDDADLEAAARGAALGAFFNAGQVCSASERILVHTRVHDEFVEKVLAEAAKVRLGHPLDPDTTMGPLNNPAVLAKVESHVSDASERGGTIMCGGKTDGRNISPYYYEATVLTGVGMDFLVNREETFGPVVPILALPDEDALLAAANNNDFGLCAAVYTQDIQRAERFSKGLRTGIVNINDASIYWEPHIPFGGASGKRSGVGRLGGAETIDALSDLKTVIY